MTAQQAIRQIERGERIYIASNCGVPSALVQALVDHGTELADCEIVHLLTFGPAAHTLPEMQEHFRHNAFFIGGNVRQAVNEGRADYIPIFLGEIPRLFVSGEMPIDVALVQVSPPDEHGFCSLGVGVDHTLDAAHAASIVIAEVNDQMPRVLGDSFLHVRDIDFVIETSRPLAEMQPEPDNEVAQQIARHVTALIEDGSTLQMGIGAIPDGVLRLLQHHRSLGIHTEMFSDGLVSLVERGVITGERKTLHPGKVIAGFMLGSKRLFDFSHNNPIIEFHRTSYTNDPFIIAQNDNMVAINSAIEIDLTGQVCSDSIGKTFYSGFGGQVDFIRGASRSRGGKPIIALPSTARDGTLSRLVPELRPGAGVVTTRADVRWVVTEYGAVNLFGLNVRKRARALIDISHPDFREQLERAARERRLL
jgi:acetyl-CoA hydrolase